MTEVPARIGAVIVAAGSGTRFSGTGPRKQYRELLGEPLAAWSIRTFARHPAVRDLVVVLPAADVSHPPDWILRFPTVRVAGGQTRGDSARLGIEALADDIDVVLVHDAVRPFADHALIDRVIDGVIAGAAGQVAAIPGIRVTDTLKEVDDDGAVVGTPDRRRFWSVQTPQAFPLEPLRRVHRRALDEGISATDDAALFERYGLPVRMVEGDEWNLKVTTPLDLAFAELLARRLPEAGG